jgi:hypothetical protein
MADKNAASKKKADIILFFLYGLCVAQFLFTLIYVNLYCKPLTQLHVALVGLSAACGILLSGIIRRSYKGIREYLDKRELRKQVAEIVIKTKEQKTNP